MEEEEVTSVVGKYTVTFSPSLGSGSFGQVFKAMHNIKGEKVAVKQIKIADRGIRNESMYEMAETEFNIIASLQSHPNVIALHEHFFTQNHFYIVMELCDHDLETFVNLNADLKFETRLKFMQQSASAVAFMHSQRPPIIHRDLKPKNILVKRGGDQYSIKVVDFGLSKIFEQQWMTSAVGTKYFQAPEFFKESEEGLQYGASVDVFSLGLIFLDLLQYGPNNKEVIPLSGKWQSLNLLTSHKFHSILLSNYR